MPKGIAQLKRTVTLANNVTPTIGSDVMVADVDMGQSRNGLLILDVSAGSDTFDDIALGVSTTSDNFTTGTAVAASDRAGLRIMDEDSGTVTITNDVVSIPSGNAGAQTYVFDVENLKQYATLQYTAGVSDIAINASLVGLDLGDAPYSTLDSSDADYAVVSG